MIDIIADILAGASEGVAAEGTSRTFGWTFDETECPDELL